MSVYLIEEPVFFHMFLNTVNGTNTESSINLFKMYAYA